MIQGHIRESLDEFDRAVKLDPEKSLYRIHRAMARTQAGRYGEAEEDFRVADGSPSAEDRLDVAINRGRMRQRMGEYAAAEAQFSGALARDPRSFDALIGRGSRASPAATTRRRPRTTSRPCASSRRAPTRTCVSA